MKISENFIFSEAQEKDLDEIAGFVNSAYRGDSSRVGWTTEADFLGGQRTDPQTLTAYIKGQNRKILCLRNNEDQSLLGCVYLERINDVKGPGCYLGMLTVKPRLQGAGIGKKLMAHAEKFALEWGATRMILTVIQIRKELIAWYERRGYRKTGGTRPFPYGDPKAGEPLRDDLHFLEFEKSLI